MRGLGVERLIIAAFSIGNARRALEDAIAYMRQRDAFGSHISDFQALRHRVADIATDIETTRAFLYDVAQTVDDGHEKSLAKESSVGHAAPLLSRVCRIWSTQSPESSGTRCIACLECPGDIDYEGRMGQVVQSSKEYSAAASEV
jgi:alkylation response protein AidB-like acyl-CoA dehydrogenase